MRAKAQSASPPATEADDVFCPLVLPPAIGKGTTFTDKVFSITPNPKDCVPPFAILNFWLCFMGLANVFSRSKVQSPERDEIFFRFRFLALIVCDGSSAAEPRHFFDARAMGSTGDW
jgi:hypothetical protein